MWLQIKSWSKPKIWFSSCNILLFMVLKLICLMKRILFRWGYLGIATLRSVVLLLLLWKKLSPCALNLKVSKRIEFGGGIRSIYTLSIVQSKDETLSLSPLLSNINLFFKCHSSALHSCIQDTDVHIREFKKVFILINIWKALTAIVEMKEKQRREDESYKNGQRDLECLFGGLKGSAFRIKAGYNAFNMSAAVIM